MKKIFVALVCAVVSLFSLSLFAKDKAKKQEKPLSEYLSQFPAQEPPSVPQSLGSLWANGSNVADLCTDYRSHHVGEAIQIQIVEQTLMSDSGSLTSQRDFKTSSAITGAAGKLNTGGLNPLLTANSSTSLKGTGQAAATRSLRTVLTGQIVSVLPNGSLVVEARRDVLMNNERQVVALRGVVRPNDVASDNSVLSTQLANLEVEVKGKGIISDSTRPPNIIMRTLLKLIGF